MKQFWLQHITVHFRRYWFSVAVLSVITIGATVFMLSQHQPQFREGGFLQATQAPKQTSKLPAATITPVDRVQSATAASCSENGPGKLLLVSISQQHIWACDGTSLANQSAVTTGASALTNVDDATPIGSWHIYSKQTNTHLRGTDVNGSWDDYVQYWMPFDGQVGFHDASWQAFAFGTSLYTTQGSHGCVHLPTDIAAWVYGWAPIGTTVTVEA